jgi:tetratricopeptide (TPR) repeat protein
VQAHIRAGKPDTALSVAQAGASATNASPDATALLAAAYAQLGNPSMAAETYRNLAANYPQRAEWRLKLAELDAGAGRTKQATTQLRSLTVDRPFDPIPYITLAQLTWPDNLPEALSIAKELGEKESYKLTGMLLEGDLLVLAGKSDEALKQFAKAAKAGAVPVALLRSIQVLDRSQQSQSADQEMASSLRKFPEDASVVGFAAQRARAQGKPALAVEYLQKIVQKDPRNAIVLNDLAWAQVEAKLPDALKNATRASELAPDSPEVLDTLGMAQAQAGKQAEAIETLRVVINLVPKVAAPRLHLAELYANAGNPKEAARVLQPLDPKTLSAKEQASFARLGGKSGT